MDDYDRLIHQRGHRVTPQRRAILQAVIEGTGHSSIDEVYQRVHDRLPDINLATVYRTLNLLKASGIIEPYYLTHDHRREQFESKPATEHCHFTCIQCGAVIEFESRLVEQLRREVQTRFGVELEHRSLCFEGYCAACAKEHL